MIYITGDMHGDQERLKSDDLRKLKKADVLIVCGDFGFVWDGSEKEKKLLKRIGKMKPMILFVSGCHDNYDLLEAYPETELFGGTVRQISGKLYELKRGGVYQIEGKTVFAFGGGNSEDLHLREEGKSWWRQELPTEEEYEYAIQNLSAADYQVDYIVTHDVSSALKQFINMETDDEEIGHLHAFLNVIGKKVDFQAWFFGKYHQDKIIPPRYYEVFRSILPAPGQAASKDRKKKKA